MLVIEFIVLIDTIQLKVLSALCQYDLLGLCFGLHTDTPFIMFITDANISLLGSWFRSIMLIFIGDFVDCDIIFEFGYLAGF